MKRTFDQLIGCSSDAGGSENESVRFSGGTIRDAVFQLINHHQDKDALLLEAGDFPIDSTGRNETKAGIKDLHPHYMHSVEGFIKMLEVESRGQEVATTAAIECAKKLKSLSEQKIEERKRNTMINVVIEAVKCLKKENRFNDGIFINQLCSAHGGISAELLWILNKEFIMTIDSYISCNLGKAVIFEALPGNIISMCRSASESERRRVDIISDLMAYLIRQGYARRSSELDHASKTLKRVTVAVLDSILKDTLKNVTELGLPHQNPFYLAFNHGGLDSETIKRCCTHLLAVTMSLNPDLKVSQALIKQSTWKYVNTPPGLAQVYNHLMLLFDSMEVLNIIKRVLARQEVNWETVLSFAATFLVLFRDASDVYRGLIRNLLQEAFENLEVENLITGFLLARQGCLEGPHVFPSYQEWFQDSFGSSTSPANNKKAFSLLVKFLTDIVPFESANILRVHIMKPPLIPAKCNDMYADYTILAKTRLSDMNEPLDPQVGIYTSTKMEGNELEDQISNDVNNALVSFEQSGKVPTIIIEASIFRKPYYIRRFLPALMKPRPLPDDPDIRMKFITALNQSGKIPTAMFNDYQSSCKRETVQLLEGLFVDDEDVILLPPEDQLQALLDQFLENISKELNDKEGAMKLTDTSTGKLSMIKERVDDVLGKECKEISEVVKPVIIGEKYDILPNICQACEMLLNTYCKLAALLSSTGHLKDNWHKPYVEIMFFHPTLLSHLYQRIWNIVISEGTSLEQHHILGLAHLLAVFASHCSGKTPMVISPSKQSTHLHEAILQELPHHDRQAMVFTFRFMTYYLQYSHCEVRSSSTFQKSILQKFQVLAYRLCPSHFNFTPLDPTALPVLEEQQLAIEIMRSENYRKLCDEVGKFSFDDWLALECEVFPEQDILSDQDRLVLYDWLLHTVYVPRSLQDGGCGGSYREACIRMFKSIVRYQMQPKVIQKRCYNHKAKEDRGSCHHLVRLLQNLCLNSMQRKVEATHVSAEAEAESAMSWMIEATDQLVSELTEYAAPVCFRFYSRLPAPLFWTNDIRVTPSEQMVRCSLNHVKKYLRNHLSDGLCLTYPCILFLLKGAFSFNSPDVAKLVGQPNEDNMCITLAIMVHWKKLHWLETCFNSDDFSRHGEMRSRVKSIFGNPGEPSTRMRTSNPQQTFACYSIMRDGDYTPIQIKKIMLSFSKVPQMDYALIVTAMSDIPLQETENWLNMQEGFRLAVCQRPNLLSEFAEGLNEKLDHVPDLSGRLRAVTFLRMMLETPKNELKVLLRECDAMKSLMDIYTNVGELYDSETKEVPLSYYQPLTTDVILAFSVFLKRCLRLCPKETLARIPNKWIATLTSMFIKDEQMDGT
ncbi:Fanconi anemia group A protein homolog [Lineus longissimus]|uniref:Fanconi anemia group A protein homolog n=1 Tax=Lineus longissimus TaxID=88925 RepID=UPI002B4EB484